MFRKSASGPRFGIVDIAPAKADGAHTKLGTMMADLEWRNVFSSNVDALAYDDETQTLYVRWARGGKTSAYSDVPPDVYEAAANNWSVGTFLNEEIKGKYSHRYV